MKNTLLTGIALLILSSWLSGCSTTSEADDIYKEARMERPLEVPPGMSATPEKDNFPVPAEPKSSSDDQ